MQGRALRAGIDRIGRFRRHHDHALALAYLGLVALGLAALAVPAVRVALLDALEARLVAQNARWAERVERAEDIVAAGDYARALPLLEALDAELPAAHAKSVHERERVRVLWALAASQRALGRKRRTLETLERLVAFDPLDYRNQRELARSCVHFHEEEQALEHYAAALAIQPADPESVREVIALRFEAGDAAGVVDTYERYLDAFLIDELAFAAGDASTLARVQADGRFHPVRVLLPRPPGWHGELVLTSGPDAPVVLPDPTVGLEVADTRLETPLRVGRPPGPVPSPEGSWRARDRALRLSLPALPDGLAAVELRVRRTKPVTPATWDAVERSYRNLLAWERLERARARSFPAEPADA